MRDGLEVLLKGWGATHRRVRQRRRDRGLGRRRRRGSSARADHRRLPARERRDGVAAIAVVRKRFGAAVPAIVVTGSSMTGHDKEALEHDFHLLIKPVLPNKLRAMIAFKLAK